MDGEIQHMRKAAQPARCAGEVWQQVSKLLNHLIVPSPIIADNSEDLE
jgi:hypothetical protein